MTRRRKSLSLKLSESQDSDLEEDTVFWVIFPRRLDGNTLTLLPNSRRRERSRQVPSTEEITLCLIAEVMSELKSVLDECERDASVGAVVLTGNEKAFVAGADIKMMEAMSFRDVFKGLFSEADHIARNRKPLIAAVRGFALGGGCELALLCDLIIAGESAQFGQPEIKLGTIPGIGGTQRLTRAVGKAKAMDMCLTGDFINAQEAKAFGLVSRVVPDDKLLEEAAKVASKIASYSQPIVQICKESVNQAFESTLTEGLHFERRMFQSTFAFEDRAIGMKAFVEKKSPGWKNQ